MSDDSPAFWITKDQVQTLIDYAHRYDALGLMVVANDVLAAPMKAVQAAEQADEQRKTLGNDAGKLRDVNNG